MATNPPKILVVYHTSEGQTARIAGRIASRLRRHGDAVDLHEVEDAPPPQGYDGIVVGDPIHAVKHSRALIRYLEAHQEAIDAMPSAFFQVSLTSANPDAEHTTTAHGMVEDLLQRTGFDPDVVGMFAGALLYTQYGWLKRHIMRAIVRREGGDLDTGHDYEYTDWDAVEQFADDVHRVVDIGELA